MARITFTAHLRQFLSAAESTAAGNTVREALKEVFAGNPRLRSYILDDQDRLRQHIAVFVDGKQISDRQNLSDRIGEESEIYVLQALSGG